MEVSPNHLLLQMESKSFRLSCIRFWNIYNSLAGRLSQGSGQVDHDDKKKTLFFFRVRQQKIPTYREGNFYCWGEKFLSVVSVLCLPWSHPREELGRIPTWPHRRWWRWHPRSSGSIFFSLISGRPRRTAWSWGFWMRSEPRQCPWSWPWSSGYPAQWAGSPSLPGGPDRQGNWKEKVLIFSYRENICVLFFTVKTRWLCISDSLKVTGFILMKSNKFRKDPRQKFGASARFVEMIWESY